SRTCRGSGCRWRGCSGDQPLASAPPARSNTPAPREAGMLRLGVVGVPESAWHEVARRLRGATLDLAAPPYTCDAVVLTREDVPAERLLDAGKHVLLADELDLTQERLAAWSALMRPGGPQLAVLDRDRYLPSRQLIRQQLDLHLGEPGLVRSHRW